MKSLLSQNDKLWTIDVSFRWVLRRAPSLKRLIHCCSPTHYRSGCRMYRSPLCISLITTTTAAAEIQNRNWSKILGARQKVSIQLGLFIYLFYLSLLFSFMYRQEALMKVKHMTRGVYRLIQKFFAINKPSESVFMLAVCRLLIPPNYAINNHILSQSTVCAVLWHNLGEATATKTLTES